MAPLSFAYPVRVLQEAAKVGAGTRKNAPAGVSVKVTAKFSLKNRMTLFKKQQSIPHLILTF